MAHKSHPCTWRDGTNVRARLVPPAGGPRGGAWRHIPATAVRSGTPFRGLAAGRVDPDPPGHQARGRSKGTHHIMDLPVTEHALDQELEQEFERSVERRGKRRRG